MIIQLYRKEHLSDLDYKMMTEYIHNTLITELVKKEAKANVEFMKRYNITRIYDTTVLKCMHVLGFRYEIYNNNYYVDSHKMPGTFCYLWKFIDQYCVIGRRMHIWVKVDKSEKIELSITFHFYI